jgi:tRNA dimethylallyltransferase
MKRRPFFLVGPTAVGKTEIAAEVARLIGAEVVSADAFQIYAGLDRLTAKPEPHILAAVPHHLVGIVPLTGAMNAAQFRERALAAIEEIHRRVKPVVISGGSGMYVKALTHGLSPLPAADPALREQLDQSSSTDLLLRLEQLDPETARVIDRRNKRRLIRALEICLLSGKPVSWQRRRGTPAEEPRGVFLFRDREDLYQRINQRVEMMFANGVVDEVRAAGAAGDTAAQTLGLEQIRALIARQISEAECIAQIQQATRRYAKRQLTWFSRQSNFEPLNLTRHGLAESIESITRKARQAFAQQDD